MADLPVLWECRASAGRMPEQHRLAVCAWLREHDVDPDTVAGVEVVVLDLPCLRVHRYYRDEQNRGRIDPADRTRALMLPPALLPMRTPPPGYDPARAAA